MASLYAAAWTTYRSTSRAGCPAVVAGASACERVAKRQAQAPISLIAERVPLTAAVYVMACGEHAGKRMPSISWLLI
ncbi:hypothetical protein VTO73DRAFT_8999 [Trametes versicolor]